MSVRDTLIVARGKIKQGWTQGTLARDLDGRSVPSVSGRAVCWCAAGALVATSYGRHYAALNYMESLISEYDSLSGWNDAPERTKEEVLALFDKAIDATVNSGL